MGPVYLIKKGDSILNMVGSQHMDLYQSGNTIADKPFLIKIMAIVSVDTVCCEVMTEVPQGFLFHNYDTALEGQPPIDMIVFISNVVIVQYLFLAASQVQ